MKAPIPANEEARLRALNESQLMDGMRDASLDEITALVAQICQTPVALVTLISESRQWFKSKYGVVMDECHRDSAFCAHSLGYDDMLVVPDALLDSRFFDNPLVSGEPHIRFYAGVPLKLESGEILGSLCVIDFVPRELSSEQIHALRILSHQVLIHFKLSIDVRKLADRELSLSINEQEQRQLAEELIIAQEVGRVGSWRLNGATGQVSWSREKYRIYEMPPESFIPTMEDVIQFIHVEDRSHFIELYASSLKDPRPYSLKHRIQLASGEIKIIDKRWQCFLNPDGSLERILGMSQDITERYHVAEKLSRVNRLYKVLSGINETIVRVKNSAKLLEETCRICTDIGSFRMVAAYSCQRGPEELKLVCASGIVDGYFQEIQICLTDDALSQGPVGIAYRSGVYHICNDVALDSRIQPWRDAALRRGYHSIASFPVHHLGEIRALILLCADEANYFEEDEVRLLVSITENLSFAFEALYLEELRLQTEQKLSEQATLLDKAQDAIIVRDLEHRVLFWNDSATRLYGWKSEEIVGKFPPIQLCRFEESYLQSFDTTLAVGEWVGELEQVGKDGQFIIVESRKTLVKNDDGTPKSILTINTDITERKKIEQNFLRSQRMESIGTLAGGIAHDLNNLFTPILLSIDLLKKITDLPRAQMILNMMSSSASRGADMVQQVLTFARGADGVKTSVDIKTIIGDISNFITETFPKYCEHSVELQPELAIVEADATQLHQVVLNLCLNSRDAMPQGGAITIRAFNMTVDSHSAQIQNLDKAGHYLCIEVEDTGTGIPDAVLKSCFDPFFTTKEVGKGTGLGLSTSLAIVQGHGGTINVHTELGMGTRFSIYLPASTEISVFGSSNNPRNELTGRGSGETILIVDDESAILDMNQVVLESAGYQVLTAANGADGICMFVDHQEKIALVLTDMMMPIVDGPSMVKILKDIFPDLKIIGSSGISTSHLVEDAMKNGMTHFIAKPYTTEILLRTIDELIH